MASTGDHGRRAEEAVRAVASTLGLPDFVYTVPLVHVGSGTREVGDALLIANGAGAIVQVKSRRPDAVDDGASWLLKHGKKAIKQAAGTRRKIREAQITNQTLTAIPVRVASLPVHLQEEASLVLDLDVQEWPAIIVVDHPGVAGQQPPDPRAFWITLDDWHELMRGLRSVTSLLEYVRRVLSADVQVSLGQEQARFEALVRADSSLKDGHGWLSFDAYNDPTGAQLYRELVERVWPNDRALPSVTLPQYRLIVEHLDAVPPSLVPQLGRWLLRKRSEQRRHHVSSGLVVVDNSRIIVFAAAEWTGPECERPFDEMLMALAAVRAAEASLQLGRFVPALAIGHLIADKHIDYRYAMTTGPQQPSLAQRSFVWHTRGTFDVLHRRSTELAAPPSDACPCGSGEWFSLCRARFSG